MNSRQPAGYVRGGRGSVALARALASQVHPVFMLPPLACSLFGAALAGSFSLQLALLHTVAVFAAVYTAHLKDGYVDFHRRDEDEDHPLTARGCRHALVAATTLFAVALVGVWLFGGVLAAALTLPTWVIAYLHAPQLDMTPVGATAGYPLGIALALLGGYTIQIGALSALPLAFALVLFILLSGIKLVDDAKDLAYDRSIGKRTVAVVVGRAATRRGATALMGLGLFLTLALTVDGVFPPSAALAPLVFAAVALIALRADDSLATMLLVRGSYLFLAALVVAVWFRPLSGLGLPDITVLGPYTYLATELAFGSVAFLALARVGAVSRALTTIALLYPVAYLWDWYTLTVGVFSIPMRTGVELLGIPVEEHLFIVVVPAVVLAIHETVAARHNPQGV
ncbi:MAG: UbiA family prenyltransferase [Halolamina sp.]|uniref:UbiA family prenyltransferase n=1 Tax=Halolamina sp. TaxID=1940283 RepID=UPI002FC2F304